MNSWITCGNYVSRPRPECWPRAVITKPSLCSEAFPNWARSARLRLWPPPNTPHRFRTKRQFWSYSGLAVVTHSSAEYEFQAGRVLRRSKPVATRGLNRNCNRRLKSVFVSAAAAGGQSDPWSEYLESLKQKGMRPEMVRLTLARKIATVALTIWKKGETFDPKKLSSTP